MNFSRTMQTLLATLTVTALIGCSPQSLPKVTKEQPPKATSEGVQHPANIQTTPAEQHPDPSQVGQLRQPNYSVRAPHMTGPKQTSNNLNDQAQQIAQVVSHIPGVHKAAVLCTGKTALVGVNLAPDITGSKIDTIKYSVKKAAERTGNGYHAVVTADVDTVQRARNLINGIRQGKPVSTVSNELADILSRLVPEM